MSRYKAILFDLCGTVMQYRLDRIPILEINGEQVQSTTPLLYACFREFDRGQIPYEKFHSDFMDVSNEIAKEKNATGEEILSSDRFERFLERLDAGLGKRKTEIHRLLMDIHLDKVGKCLELLLRHRDLLKEWKMVYPIGLITNFDDAKTIRHVLAREEITDLFETIQISAELGIRKPRKEIFNAALNQLNTNPSEGLFVGDNWKEDIIGAKKLGIETAWINPDRLPQPKEGIRSDYDLSDLSELQRIL